MKYFLTAFLLVFAVSALAQGQLDPRFANLPEYVALAPAAPQAEETGYAWTYDKWTPPPALVNACSTDVHNWYSAVADDGLRYPTWHPPTDPSGCHFGHSHGMNPRLSPLYKEMGEVYLGYVAEQMSKQDIVMHRHEAHEGYKITWAHQDYQPVKFLGFPSGPTLSCDLMSVIHMGTFNPDAFTNNQHEQHFRTFCLNTKTGELATRDHVKLMSIIGNPGSFHPTCGGVKPKDLFFVGPAVPSDSPATNPLADAASLGLRRIPTSDCLIKPRLNAGQDLLEVWQTGNGLEGPDGKIVIQPHWYWFASTMSRFFDKRTGAMGKSLNVCYEKDVAGKYIVISNPCVDARRAMPNGPFAGVVCHPQNPFDGDTITIRFTTLIKNNPSGPEVFYSNVHGRNSSVTKFAGGVKQEVSRGSLPARGFRYTGTKDPMTYKDTDAFLCDQN